MHWPESKTEGVQQYLLSLAFGKLSMLELRCLADSNLFTFQIQDANERVALIDSDLPTLEALMARLGGAYKASLVLGKNLEGALNEIIFPNKSKFCWTVSTYCCGEKTYYDAKERLLQKLKLLGLGKSKFLQPRPRPCVVNTRSCYFDNLSYEMDIEELYDRILSPKEGIEAGVDLVICSGLKHTTCLYGQTGVSSDIEGFHDRDFLRPHKDPRITMSPRLARLMVNLGLSSEIGSATVLDPFCGLGTILQEAICCGYDVIGVERDERLANRAMENLTWCLRRYGKGRQQSITVLKQNTLKLQRHDVPRCSGIVSEPILLRTYRSNPSRKQAIADIRRAEQAYHHFLLRAPNLLSDEGSRVVLSMPGIVDSSGSVVSFSMRSLVSGSQFSPYYPQSNQDRIDYPLRVPSQKKRIVRRAVTVYRLRGS